MILSDLSVVFESNKTKAIKENTDKLKENIRTQLQRELVEDATLSDDVANTIMRMSSSWDLLTTSISNNIKVMAAWLTTTPAGWFTMATAAIFGIVKAYDLLTISNKEALEISKEAQDKIGKINDSYLNQKKVVDDCVESYEKLSKGVDISTNKNLSLSSEDYKEYLRITNQLAETFPSLVRTIDENGTAILNLGQNGKTAADDLRELLKAEEDLNNYKIAQNIDDLFGGIKVQVNETIESSNRYEESIDGLEDKLNKINDLASNSIDLSSASNLNLKDIDIEYYDSIINGINKFYNALDPKRQKELLNLSNIKDYSRINENGLYDLYADFSLLTEEEKKVLQNEIKLQAQENADTVSNTFKELSLNNVDKENQANLAWKDFIPNVVSAMKSLNSFQSLDSDMQSIAIQIVSSLDKSVAKEIESSDGVDNYLRNYIISKLAYLNNEDKDKLLNAFNDLLKLNPNDLSESNQIEISKLLSILTAFLDQDENWLRINLGFKVDEDFEVAYSKAIQETIDRFGVGKDKAESMFSFLGIDSNDEIVKWNEVTKGVDNAEEAVMKYIKALEKANETPVKNTITDTITNLDSFNDKFDAITKAYKTFSEKGKDGVRADGLSDIIEAYKNIDGIDLDGFITTLISSESTTKDCQDAWDSLATQIIFNTGILDGLTEATAEQTAKELKAKGVVNASTIVKNQLAAANEYATVTGKKLEEVTGEEVMQFLSEQMALDNVQSELVGYYLAKIDANALTLSTSGDIKNIENLVSACGHGVTAIQAFYKAKQGYEESLEKVKKPMENILSFTQLKVGMEAYKNTGEKTQYLLDYEADLNNIDNFMKEQKELADNALAEIRVAQSDIINGNSGNLLGVAPDETDKSGSDPKEEEIDWIERKKEILQRLHDVQEEIANNEMESYQERAEALDYLIEKDKERVEAAKNAVSQYEKAWKDASANLTDEDKKFIEQGGDIVKKYNSQELLNAGIVDSLEAGEEYIDNLKSAQDWYDKMIESQKEELAHQKESIEHQKQKIQLLRDQIAAQQDLNDAITDQVNSQKELDEAQGKYIGKAYYEDLISKSEERKSLIQENIDRLNEQLELTEEESAERNNILAEIENCKNELIQCEVEQAELNDTIMRLPIERLQMLRDLYAQIIEDMDNYRSIQDKLGLQPTKEELQSYIDLYSESINDTIKQQDQLKNLLKNYSYGSDKFKETSDEIQSLDNEISNLIANQIELNYQMLQIPVTEMSEEIDKLGIYKDALNNAIAEDNAKGLQTTVDQYKDLHSITLQQLGLYAQQKAELTKLLDVYDENSQYYKDTEQQIADIDNQMSSLVQDTYKWNEELLNIPIDNLEKVNENLSNYSSILGDVIASYDEALEGVNTLIDTEIEGIQDQLDLLNETNEARKIQLALEQAQYNLEKARNQKTTKVIRDGQITYEANVDEMRSAQQELADAQYDKMVYDLEQQIERLEDIKEKWAEIVEAIEKAKDLQAAEDLFGAGWQDSVLADSNDLRDIFQSLYESTYNEKEAVDKQIVSNERMIQMMNELISRYRDGSITYEEALSGINSMTDSADGNYTAIEMLNDMMSLDNISGLKDISEATQVSVDETVGLLKQYLQIAESNKESVKHFETSLEGMSQDITEIVETFKKSAGSLQAYIDAYKANSEAINQNTKTWEEMKKLIEEQVKALKKSAEELEKQQQQSSSSKPSSSSGGGGGSSKEYRETDRVGVTVNGTTYWESSNGNGGYTYTSSSGNSGSSYAELVGSYGSDAEKESYREYREDIINSKADKSGDEGWREAALKALDEELKNAGVYHKGIFKGPVGFSPLSNDEIYSFAKRVAVNPLKADEVMAILQKGEFVTQPDQMSNIMRNNQLIGQMASERANSAIKSINNVARDNVIDFSIGEIHLHEVQNVDEFAKALSQTFASSMQQNFSKIFKK